MITKVPPEVTSHPGEDPISQKKLQEGEGTWSTTKELLGWIIDGENYTVHLDQSRCKAITTLITQVAHQKKCPLQKFQKVAGKLQHASFAIPGGKASFHRFTEPCEALRLMLPSLPSSNPPFLIGTPSSTNSPPHRPLSGSSYPSCLIFCNTLMLASWGVVALLLLALLPSIMLFGNLSGPPP